MKPVILEVMEPMLSTVEMNCRSCGLVIDALGLDRKIRSLSENEYPEYRKQTIDHLSDWLNEISRLYRHRLQIRYIDAQSPLGLWTQLRYRVFRFPAFIVDKKYTYTGWEPQALEVLIDKRILAQTRGGFP